MRKFVLSLAVVLGLATFANAQVIVETPGCVTPAVAIVRPAFAVHAVPVVAVSPLVAVNRRAVIVNAAPVVRVNAVGVRRANVRVRIR